jgi:hypothetical protein
VYLCSSELVVHRSTQSLMQVCLNAAASVSIMISVYFNILYVTEIGPVFVLSVQMVQWWTANIFTLCMYNLPKVLGRACGIC